MYREDAEKWVRGLEREMETTGFVDRKEAEANTLAKILQRYKQEVTPRKKSAEIEAVIRQNSGVIAEQILAAGESAGCPRPRASSWRAACRSPRTSCARARGRARQYANRDPQPHRGARTP